MLSKCKGFMNCLHFFTLVRLNMCIMVYVKFWFSYYSWAIRVFAYIEFKQCVKYLTVTTEKNAYRLNKVNGTRWYNIFIQRAKDMYQFNVSCCILAFLWNTTIAQKFYGIKRTSCYYIVKPYFHDADKSKHGVYVFSKSHINHFDLDMTHIYVQRKPIFIKLMLYTIHLCWH